MITEKFRRKIDTTRVMMLLGVVLIHCNILSLIPGGGNLVVAHVVGYFSVGLPSICVPWFFFISAYLSSCRSAGTGYVGFLRKRVRTILVPYLIWNTLAVLIRMVVQFIPMVEYTSGGHHFSSLSQSIVEIYVEPALGPLWFLRNLFVFTLLYPAIRRLIGKNLPIALAVLLAADNFAPLGGIFYYGAGIATASRFTPGKVMSILDRCRLLGVLYCVAVLVCNIADFDIFAIPVVRNILSLVGLTGMWSICRSGTGVSRFRFVGFPDAIFFVYAFHGIISPYIVKGLARFIPWESYGWLGCYFMAFVAIVTVSYFAYYVVGRLCPHAAGLLTGGRSAVV